MASFGFIRTKVLQADRSGGLNSPFIAVNVKEAMQIPGELVNFFFWKQTQISLSHDLGET